MKTDIQIDRATNNIFGTLTFITSKKTGQIMFLAREVAIMWGHKNIRAAIARLLSEDEVKVVSKSRYPGFFKDLVSSTVLQSKVQRIMVITESGMYKLALASNLEKAKPFKDWVTKEVIPSIRKKGYYSIADQTGKMMIHTDINIQKQNSKDVNRVNFEAGGVESTIEYNRQSMILHTGKTPSEIKEMGKEAGLKSSQRSSGKEVLRHTNPAMACTMSFTDSLVKMGFDLKTVSDLAKKAALPLYNGMLELGITPGELRD